MLLTHAPACRIPRIALTQPSDESLAAEFSARRADAEAFLWREMAKLGLRAEDGWSITEITRERGGGSELVLRPIHRSLSAPDGLECVVRISEERPGVSSECSPPDGERRTAP